MSTVNGLGPCIHGSNWYGGWSLLLAAIAAGAVLGRRFHDEHFWGGYASFRRRLTRLGHVALAAMGLLNLVFSISPIRWGNLTAIAGTCLLAAGVAMPLLCFLTA